MGRTKQHLITKAVARRSIQAAQHRDDDRFVLPCCLSCNVRVGTSLRVPVGYRFKRELEEITGCRYGVFDGDRGLTEVVRRQ
jgi:hypothetical protein